MKPDDIRLLRYRAQDLGIKYVSQYTKKQLKAMIAERDPQAMMDAIFGTQPYTATVRIPAGVKTIQIKLEVEDED